MEDKKQKKEEKKECGCGEECICSDNLNKKLEEAEKKTAEYLAGWQRERADFLNYKKEEMERITGLVGYAAQELVIRMLPILDNFDIAEKKINEELEKDENPEGKPSASYRASVKGLLLIKNQILEFLKSQGIEEIKSIGDPPSHKASDGQGKFDPKYMEAVEEVEIEGKEPGTVIEIVQKGYKVNGELLRPAKVRITK